ncbi:hypothetical protein FHS10_001426 [Mucilaginibacter dorajii]|nr:hypothetical protein [Mucilaginibacter dorajii]
MFQELCQVNLIIDNNQFGLLMICLRDDYKISRFCLNKTDFVAKDEKKS